MYGHMPHNEPPFLDFLGINFTLLHFKNHMFGRQNGQGIGEKIKMMKKCFSQSSQPNLRISQVARKC